MRGSAERSNGIKRTRWWRWALGAAVLGVLGLIACSEYAFLDDMPPYAPAEPFIEERELQNKRVNAQREAEERQRNRYMTETREQAIREWRELEAKKQRGVERLRADQERRDHARKNRGPQNLDEWQRLVK